MPTIQIITFILGSVVVIFGAYFATCLVARGSHKMVKGRAIQVLDRFSLSKDKALMLVAVYDKIYLLAFAAGAVTLLDQIEPETAASFAQNTERAAGAEGVGGMLAKLGSLLGKNKEEDLTDSIPFEAYLHPNQQTDNADKLDIVYSMMQNRKEKDIRRNALGDNAYFEEDSLK